MIYHILRIIAYLLTFVALNLIFAGIVDGFKNGIINNDGWITTFILIFNSFYKLLAELSKLSLFDLS